MEECQVCKQNLSVLTEYHCNQHGLTKDEYRAKYGVVKAKNTFRIPKSVYTVGEIYEMEKFKRRRH